MSHFTFRTYLPKLVTSLREGYSARQFLTDLFAGVSIGVISIPLAMAFAIGSGLPPERGLFTAIVAGFLISAFGGSRVQIGGPTGAFVVVVFDIAQRQGYEGLVLATIIAGLLLICMGFFRFGALLKYIPYPVVMGLTTGIALVLFSSQIKDFLGLDVASVPADFIGKWHSVLLHLTSINIAALLVGAGTIVVLWFLRRHFPRLPAAIIAVILAACAVAVFHLPVETIQTRFGAIPNSLPTPSLPLFSLERIRELMPDAITIALLAGLESLLSAVVADGMTGFKHRSNAELIGQGVGNIGSAIFGGIPATGALARTATNVRLGAKTPVSGMIHAVTVLVILFFFAKWAELIPLASLAGLLTLIAWNMAEVPHIKENFNGPKSDGLLFLITFALAVLIDITVAVEVGVLLSAVLFVKRMSADTELKRVDRDEPFTAHIPEEIEVLQFHGPLFFGAVDLLNQAITLAPKKYKIVIVRMSHVPLIDLSGVKALQAFVNECDKLNIELYFCGARPKVHKVLKKTHFRKERFFPHFQAALAHARKSLER